MLHLSLYKYTDKPIIVDKTSYLGTPLNVTGDALSGNQDMENPVVLLHFTEEPDYNYAYIQEYHRWYYLTNKTWVSGDVWSMTWAVDELYTYRTLVRSLDGLVAYSNLGSTFKRDPRLVYNMPPTRTVVYPELPANTGGYWVLLRYYNVKTNLTLLPAPPWSIECVYMSLRAYNAFLDSYMRWLLGTGVDEKKMVAVGSSIIDISLVYYCGDYHSFGVASDLDISFGAPAVLKANNGFPVVFSASVGDGIDLNCYAFHINPLHESDVGHMTYSFTRGSVYDWTRSAEFVVYLPYIGKITLNPAKLGLGNSLTYDLKIKVQHECASNTYVVTAMLGNTELKETRAFFNVQTTIAFPVDSSFENRAGAVQNAMLNLAANGIGALAAGALGSPAMGISAAATMSGNIADTMYRLDNLAARDALSKTMQGTIGGSADFVDSAGTEGMEVFAVITTTPPSDNYAYFWAEHGMPDGAHRNLADLTGYVQMQEFEMKYDSNATEGEMARLEAQLYKGVIL